MPVLSGLETINSLVALKVDVVENGYESKANLATAEVVASVG